MKNGVWRLLRLLVPALISAIRPPATLGALRAAPERLHRHLREPPRARQFKPVHLVG